MDDGDTSDDATSSGFSVSNLDDVSEHMASDPEMEGRTYMVWKIGRVNFRGTPSEFSTFKTQSMVEATSGPSGLYTTGSLCATYGFAPTHSSGLPSQN